MRLRGGLFGVLATALLLCGVMPARAQSNVTIPDPNLEAGARWKIRVVTHSEMGWRTA